MSLKSKIQMTLAGMAICVAASAQTSWTVVPTTTH